MKIIFIILLLTGGCVSTRNYKSYKKINELNHKLMKREAKINGFEIEANERAIKKMRDASGAIEEVKKIKALLKCTSKEAYDIWKDLKDY